MRKTNTNELLSALTSQAEQHLQRAIQTYQNLTNTQLNRPSATGGWSIARCMDHLNSYGEYYFPIIEKALSSYSGKPCATAKRGWLGNYFINMMDPDISTKGYKAFKSHMPAALLNGHEVVARFIEQQEKLIELLRMAAKADLNRVRIPISITKLIRLRLGDTFEFLIMHNERHIRQADRV